jgi:hypothetical protein
MTESDSFDCSLSFLAAIGNAAKTPIHLDLVQHLNAMWFKLSGMIQCLDTIDPSAIRHGCGKEMNEKVNNSRIDAAKKGLTPDFGTP